MTATMTDLDYFSKKLEEFEEQYSKFSACLPDLLAACRTGLNVPLVETQSDYLVLGLAKLCLDRFEDIFILCLHSRGDGAMPLVRLLFESLVNASYIHAHPEKAEDFERYLFLFIKKVQRQIEQLNGRTLSADQKKLIDDALRLYSRPDGKPSRQNDWTEASLVDRAKDVGLGEFVVTAYYRPLEIAHPSMIHVYSMSRVHEGQRQIFGNSMEFSRQRAQEALAIAHSLMIEVLKLLHGAFGNDELVSCITRCDIERREAWKGIFSPEKLDS